MYPNIDKNPPKWGSVGGGSVFIICSLYREILHLEKYPEMGFLDINLTTDSSLLLHANHIPFYWRILKNPYSSFPQKKICETRKLESIH
jgi:hypothetical protein